MATLVTYGVFVFIAIMGIVQILMKNARKSPYFNAGMDRAKLT